MTTPPQSKPDLSQLSGVLRAAARLYYEMNACGVPLRAVIGPERVSLQVMQSAGDVVVRQELVARMGSLMEGWPEPGLVGDGLMFALEVAGTQWGRPVHVFTWLDPVPEVPR